MNRSIARLGFTALALAAGSVVATAQSSTSGSIYGVVTDEKGNPLAGVTVRITSAQVSRVDTTPASGAYRFGLLNPGAWHITITKPGFQTQTRDVSVATNTNQNANIKLQPVAQTTVEVVATSAAAVDVTSTQTGYTADLRSLESLPMGRDVNTVANFSPGVVDSGRLGGLSIAGASGLENQFIVDGLTSTDMRSGFQGATMPSDFVEQVEVQTGGFKPEFSALGGVFNVVTKSGSNNFAGSAWATIDARSLEAVSKKNDYFKQTSPQDRYDVGIGIGGAIVKDKLFYYLGVASTNTKAAGEANTTGQTNGEQKTDNLQIYAKVNWYPAQDHQFTFTVKNDTLNDNWEHSVPDIGDAEWGRKIKNETKNYGLNYDWTISSNLFLSVKFGQVNYSDSTTPVAPLSWIQDNVYIFNNPKGTIDPGTRYSRGGYGLYDAKNESTNQQIKADLSWFLGSHNLKFGISQQSADFKLIQYQTGPTQRPYYDYGAGPVLGPSALGYRVGIRFDDSIAATGGNVAGFNGIDLVYFGNNAKVKAVYDAYYAQDTWEVITGLRVFYGFRYEGQTLKNNKGETALQFTNFKDNLSPRVGFTWDVNNDGKTKIAGSYSMYYEAIPLQPVMRSGGAEQYVRNRYSAANSTYDGTHWSVLNLATPSGITDFAGNFAAPPLADGTKLPRRTEYTLGLDQTLPSGWLMGVHAKYRKLERVMEDSVITDSLGNPLGDTDPNNGGYAILWNPHPGVVSWTGGPAATVPGQHYVTVPQNLYPEAYNEYKSVDLTFERKTSKYALNFSWTWSRLYGNYEGLGQSSNGQADANITSSFDYWPYVGTGLLPLDRTHVVKLFGSYNFDLKGDTLMVGFNALVQSGTPNNLFDDGSTTHGHTPGWDTLHTWKGNVYANLDPVTGHGIGTPLYPSLDIGGYGDAVPANFQYGQYGRTPTTFNVDLKLEYTHKFGKVAIKPSIDAFNIFNSRKALTRQDLATDQNGGADPRYGAERSWQEGRRYRFGVKVQF